MLSSSKHVPQSFHEECDLDGFLGSLTCPFTRTQLDRMGRVYNQAQSAAATGQKRHTIPKVIHQIWIGSKPIPAEYRRFMSGWRQHYPDWDLRLWTDSEVKALNFDTKDLVDASHCFGQKTDLIRAEILYQQGGLYIDTDYESLRPLDDIHESYDFYGTLRALPMLYLASPATYPSPLLVCNSMIGSRPGHPILRSYLDKVRDISRHPNYFKLKLSEHFTLARVKFTTAQIQRIKETTIKTYIPWHMAVLDHLESGDDRNIIFPPTFFNPIDTWHSYRFVIWRYWMKRLSYWSQKNPVSVRKYQAALPQTFTIHHSKASWAGL